MCLTRVTINNLITWKWHILLVCTHRGFPSWHKNSFQCKLQLSGITEDSLLFKTVITFPVCHYANTLCSCLKSLVAELLVSATSAMQNITSVECKSLNTNWSQRLCWMLPAGSPSKCNAPCFSSLGNGKKKELRVNWMYSSTLLEYLKPLQCTLNALSTIWCASFNFSLFEFRWLGLRVQSQSSVIEMTILGYPLTDIIPSQEHPNAWNQAET